MKSLLLTIALMSAATAVHADWTLNQADSTFTFSSIKKDKIFESHTFNQYEGSIDDKGNALLTLDLGSVNTKNPVRDERMKTMLFNIVKFPSASYKMALNLSEVDALKTGQRLQYKADGDLSLFGESRTTRATLNVYKLTDNKILVTTAHPIVIKAEHFGLSAGIDALQAIASLPSITHVAPINFNLVFDLSK